MINAMALMGATGVGKSRLALRVAHEGGMPIISCDSMQVYRGLDIGTAKPGPEDRNLVSHHLIDCISMPQVYSAMAWAKAAGDIIRTMNERGTVPLIAGGTGLYLRALLEGLSEIPDENPLVRQRLRQQAEMSGIAPLYEQLMVVDPATAGRLNQGDSQRILRALSVFESTGRPISLWTEKQEKQRTINCPVYILEMAREDLRQRLRTRFEKMLENGWMLEVNWLLEQRIPDAHPAMRAVGYRQLIAHARGTCGLDLAVEQGITATRRYAKRQQTWCRNQIPHAITADAARLETVMLQAVA